MSDPLISVIIPAYNAEPWIRQAIESVLNQSLQNIEVFVVDDGSVDRTGEVAEGFSSSGLRVFRRTANLGKPLSVQEVFPLVRGRYTTIHDADDISFCDRLEKQVEALESDPDLALCGTGHVWVDVRGRPYRRVVLAATHEAIVRGLPVASQFHGPTVVIRTDVLRAFGEVYRSYFRWKCEDNDLCYRIAQRHKVGNLPEILYATRIVPTSLSRGRVDIETLNMYRFVVYLAGERAATGSDALERGDDSAIARFWMNIGEPYRRDPSRIHREAAAYYLGWHLCRAALARGMQAIRTRPQLLLNYKHFAVLAGAVAHHELVAGLRRLSFRRRRVDRIVPVARATPCCGSLRKSRTRMESAPRP